MHIGIDIGGTKTDAVVIDERGAMVQQLRLTTGYGPDAVLQTAVDAVTRVAELAGIRVDEAVSIGIGVPGRVDAAAGRVAHAVNLGVDGLDLGAELSARLGSPVRIENDVNAAALGAYQLLEAEGWPAGTGTDWPAGHEHSMAYLNLGTGLAAGIVVAGRLWRGSRGTAGEIGHIPVDPAGPLCPCGQRGCLELMASGSAIARQWPTEHPQPAQQLFEAADGGDPLAIEVRTRLLENVASAVRVLVLTVDVDVVVIGGGIASLGAALLDGVRSVLAHRAQESPFLASLELADRVRLMPTGFPSAAVGAAFVGASADAGAVELSR
ncbi:MAG TPA: ROK family protein [Terrimesophilobacter sp.]|nr:ROK family protein [Terrimesophilobacter sp.]